MRHSPIRYAPLVWLAGAAALMLAGCSANRLIASAELARQSEPLQQQVAQPRARLLVVGDSTAVGTGATSPRTSLAGLLATRWPDLHIDNRATDGATFDEVLRQIPDGARFDIVLVQAGGNDVIRWRDLDTVAAHVDATARKAREVADLVILMPAGNVGNSPFFFRPLAWAMTSRARRLHEAVRTSASRHGAVYVNLFKERGDDPFARQRELTARDGLHPSDRGYQLWFDELLAQSSLAGRLAPGQRTAEATR